jgi:hypothetical protein
MQGDRAAISVSRLLSKSGRFCCFQENPVGYIPIENFRLSLGYITRRLIFNNSKYIMFCQEP